MKGKPQPTPPTVDRQTWEALFDESYHWALACCRYDRQEAEEVLQATYVKVLEGTAVFEGRSSPKTWLFAVIRRTAQERRRRGLLGTWLLGKWTRREASPEAASQSQEGDLLKIERRKRILAALQDLPVRQREILELVFYQDMTLEEASRVLGITVGTARTHYERGKKTLRLRLDKEWIDET